MKRKTLTGKTIVVSAVRKFFLTSVIVGLGFLYVAVSSNQVAFMDEAGDGNYGRPDAPGSPAALVHANDCWSDVMPADMQGKIPGHVVVSDPAHATFDNPSGVTYGGTRLVGKALEQAFENKKHNLTIHAFCR